MSGFAAFSAYGDVRLQLPSVAPRLLGGATMGTRWSLKYATHPGVPGARVEAAVQQALATVVEQMSTWDAGSAISRFNRAAPGSRHALPPAFAGVMEAALHWARASGGAFDPTVGPLVDAWGFGPREGERDYAGARPPEVDARNRAQASVGWQRLDFSPVGCMLTQPGGLRLDLSGIAKGFAVDLACEAVRACGVDDFLMEIGGELRAEGERPGGGDWTVGIEQAGSAALLPLALRQMAVATSGERWHAFEHEGVRYAHTLDPRTGAPVAHGLASVTVAHARCVHADAAATALMVLGPEAGPVFAERHGLAAWFLRRSETGFSGHASPAFARLL